MKTLKPIGRTIYGLVLIGIAALCLEIAREAGLQVGKAAGWVAVIDAVIGLIGLAVGLIIACAIGTVAWGAGSRDSQEGASNGDPQV